MPKADKQGQGVAFSKEDARALILKKVRASKAGAKITIREMSNTLNWSIPMFRKFIAKLEEDGTISRKILGGKNGQILYIPRLHTTLATSPPLIVPDNASRIINFPVLKATGRGQPKPDITMDLIDAIERLSEHVHPDDDAGQAALVQADRLARLMIEEGGPDEMCVAPAVKKITRAA